MLTLKVCANLMFVMPPNHWSGDMYILLCVMFTCIAYATGIQSQVAFCQRAEPSQASHSRIRNSSAHRTSPCHALFPGFNHRHMSISRLATSAGEWTSITSTLSACMYEQVTLRQMETHFMFYWMLMRYMINYVSFHLIIYGMQWCKTHISCTGALKLQRAHWLCVCIGSVLG